MSEGWQPSLATKGVLDNLIDTLLREMPVLLGVDELIPGCEVIHLDPAGVGLGTLPRYIRVRIHEYYQDILYRGGLTFIVGDFLTVLHFREGDIYEVYGPGGSAGVAPGYLLLDASNDPVTAGLEINAATTGEPVLILQTTDDNAANPILLLQDLGGNTQVSVAVDGGAVFNEEQNDADFRVESANQANMLFVDGGFDSVLINTAVDFASTFGVQTTAAADKGIVVRGSAAQSANLLELQESDGSIVVASGDGLGGSVFSGNVQLEDIDFVWAGDTEANLFRVDAGLDVVRLGDWDTNYSQFDIDGDLSFTGTARIDWSKITANSVTLTNGTTPASVVADLQTAHDGNFYHIDEAVGAPGINLIVDFVSVTAFNWVNVLAGYDGSTAHAVGIQLYNWSTTAWDTFHACQDGTFDVATASGYIMDNKDFFVPDDANYIGTGGSAGQVRVRFYHTMVGNNAHDLDIDVVALYQ